MGVEFLDHMVILFNLLRNCQTVSQRVQSIHRRILPLPNDLCEFLTQTLRSS